MLGDPHHALPPELYRRNGHQMAETIPPHCPNGHRFVPDQVLVTWRPCLCTPGHTGHRSWRCQRCDEDLIWPSCTRNPGIAHWDGESIHRAAGRPRRQAGTVPAE